MKQELGAYSMNIQPESSKDYSGDSTDIPGNLKARSEKHVKEWKWDPRLKAQNPTQVW